ncbi:MAG TPA: hypothetical protein PKA83_17965 [Pirellulaceae bacterium]|nr:hypothetical protein [Pirellulaceae bacterium]
MVNSQPLMRMWGIRLTGLAFVVFAALHVFETGNPTPSDLAMGAVVGSLGAIVVLGPAWILLATVGLLGGYYRRAQSSASSVARRRQLESEKRAMEKNRQQELIDWERGAPERERAYREESQRRELEGKRNAESQKRRVDARADCEMMYQLYAVDIGDRFPRTEVDAWITKYMGDGQSPDEVEQRAEQLRSMIVHHREQVNPSPKFSNLQELALWFQDQTQQIEKLPVPDRLKRILQAQLNARNSDLMEQVLEKL